MTGGRPGLEARATNDTNFRAIRKHKVDSRYRFSLSEPEATSGLQSVVSLNLSRRLQFALRAVGFDLVSSGQ